MEQVTVEYHLLMKLEDGEEEQKNTFEGFWVVGKGEWLLRYLEQDGSQTTWLFQKDRAILTRRGEISYQQIFTPEKQQPFQMQTFAGPMDMRTNTIHYQRSGKDRKKSIILHYQLFTATHLIGEYQLKIAINK